jgi:hypothetical protein
MKTLYTFAAVLFLAQALPAQTPLIFRPAPGSNDGTDEGGVSGGKDAWVYEGDASMNYGITGYIQALPISNCNATHCEAFIQFDLSSLPADVDSVYFGVKHFPHTTYCYSGCDADFYFAIITAAWDETTINYNNFPARGSDIYGPVNISFPNDFGVVEYDITDAYRNWKNGTVPNYGFTIYSTTVACNNAAVYFNVSSSDDTEEANRPYLKIITPSVGIESSLATQMGLQCYPNPAGNQATLEFTLDATQNIVFELVDVTGRLVSTREYDMAAGTNRIIIPLGDVNAGLYYYRLKTNAGEVAGKLIKR